MRRGETNRSWFWATLLLSSVTIVALVFAFWEVVENRFFRDIDYVSLHYLYISRGIASGIFLAIWAAWFVLRDRRRTEVELRQSRERYRGLLEASPEAVTLFDAKLVVHEWNASAERLYGFSKAEAIGNVLPNVAQDCCDELRSLMKRVSDGHPVLEHETQRRDRAGNAIDVQLSFLPFREHGELYFLEIAADIRERVRLRERLIEFEKLTTMGEMAAGTAHHLNTPLASLLLRVQMMRERTGGNHELASDLGRVEQTIGFCQKFVRRLLDFSRRPSALREREPIAPVIEAVLGFLSPSFVGKQANVTWARDGVGELAVLADRNQIEMLLLILLSNALDAIAPGGEIHVAAGVAGADLELSIRDNGCGIPDNQRGRIFEPFFTTKPVGKGTGLGLAIAKSIVTQHGGEIVLESAPGAGTCARVRLPLVAAGKEMEARA